VSGAVLLAVLFLVPGGIVSIPRRITQVVRAVRRRRPPSPPDRTSPSADPESTENEEPRN
jgi:branched-chain amino acid transport system permease protein